MQQNVSPAELLCGIYREWRLMCELCFTGKMLSINTPLSRISVLGYGISPWTQAFQLLMHCFMHFLPLEKTTTQHVFFSQCCPQTGLATGRKPLGASLKLHPVAHSQNQQGIQQSAHCKFKDFLCFLVEFLWYRSSKSIE